MQAVDADAHVDETDETWEYLGEGERRYKPLSLELSAHEAAGPSDGRRHKVWLVGGNARLHRFRSDEATGTTQATRELLDIGARLRHLDELGIEVQALYPTTFLHAVTDRPEIDVALCKSYNRWIADRTAGSGGRLRWVAQAPMLSITDAVAELRFAKDHGACGVMKKGVEAGNRPSGDPYFYPLYEEANRLDLPICVHQGTGDADVSNTASVVDTANMSVLSVLSAFKSLANAGVPDMFPRLRFGFIEAGASWIPYLIKDIGMRGKAARAPYDFKTGFLAHNRFFVTCDTEDDIPNLLTFGAEDYLMIGTDYAHSDPSSEMLAHRVVMQMAEQGQFSTAVANKIVNDNGRRFYGF
jgi:predicted TIM-barrel fold metal-dependent hydrolase